MWFTGVLFIGMGLKSIYAGLKMIKEQRFEDTNETYTHIYKGTSAVIMGAVAVLLGIFFTIARIVILFG